LFLQNTFAVKKFWKGVFSSGRRKGYIKVKIITLKRVFVIFMNGISFVQALSNLNLNFSKS